MCFSKWLVLTDHYGWRRKRGLLKYMCQNCFSFCFIKKCLGAVFVLTSTSWHLYYIMVHGSFWGCLEQMYQPVQFLNPFFYLHTAAYKSVLKIRSSQLLMFQAVAISAKRPEIDILWYWSVTHLHVSRLSGKPWGYWGFQATINLSVINLQISRWSVWSSIFYFFEVDN